MPALMTRGEVAAALGIGEDAVYRLEVRGAIRFCKVGNRSRFDPAWVDEYIAAHALKPRGGSHGGPRRTGASPTVYADGLSLAGLELRVRALEEIINHRAAA